jgi:hypothetical protein
LISKKGFDESKLLKPELSGEYQRLGIESMEVFLPEGFKELSDEEIKEFHKQIEDKRTRYYYEKSFEQQSYLKGNFYRFYGAEYASEVIIRTLPYMPFNKGDATYLLAYLQQEFDKYQRITGVFHNKIKATYSGEKSLQVFKAKYRMTRWSDENSDEKDYIMFKTVYLITINKKTFMYTILMPGEFDFDPFVRKIKL